MEDAGINCDGCGQPLYRPERTDYLLCGVCPRYGEKVQLCGETAARTEKPITGRVVGFSKGRVKVIWDHRPNAISPGLVLRECLRPVDVLQKLSEI
jgi:hypothetical protein